MRSSIVSILEEFLGPAEYSSDDQITFDCPNCSAEKGLPNGDGKHNLEVNLENHVFRCWVCWENGTQGSVYKLIRNYGNKRLLNRYLKEVEYLDFKKSFDEQSVNLEILNNEIKRLKLVKPTGIENFIDENLNKNISFKERCALDYLFKRNIKYDIINKFKIGYVSSGTLEIPSKNKVINIHNRIYLPSYNSKGYVNYFTLRDFSEKEKKYKYINPEYEKEEIIFNEYYINYDSDIYLVEGPFDHIVVPNSIPMLGKELYDLIYFTLQEKAKANVIIFLDGDAYEKAKLIYKKLNCGNLKDRIKIIKVNESLDPSKIYEKYGNKGMLQTLQSAHKLSETELSE